MKSTFLYCIASLWLSGCVATLPLGQFNVPSQSTSKPAGAPYKELNVVVDVNALEFADATNPNSEKLSGTISKQIKAALESEFQRSNVQARITVETLQREITQTGNTTTVKKSTRKLADIVSAQLKDRKLLLVQIDRLQHTNQRWDGSVGWRFVVFDPQVPVTKYQDSLWMVQSPIMFFSPPACLQDEYQTCAKGFATSLFSTLKLNAIIP